MSPGALAILSPADRLHQQLDRRFPRPSAKDTARVFAEQIKQLRPGILHDRVTPVAKHSATERTVNSTSTEPEKLETFAKRFAIALRRRLYPCTALHIKQFAYAMRRSEATVWSWLAGERSVRGDDLMSCIAFFGADFANELLEPAGCMVVKMDDARAAAARKIAEGYAELKAMESGR